MGETFLIVKRPPYNVKSRCLDPELLADSPWAFAGE